MEIDHNIITFKSIPKFFDIEQQGTKNNTVRRVTPEEKSQIRTFLKSNWPYSVFIHIINTETDREFYREIRDVSTLEPDIVIFTWEEEVPVCCSKCWKPVTPDIQIAYSIDEYGEPMCVECE